MPRRKPGSIIDLEAEVLLAAATGGELHGYQFAQRVDRVRPLIGHGTIYKALGRLEDMGLLTSRWEEPTPGTEGRPRRRLYRITAAGSDVVRDLVSQPSRSTAGRPVRVGS